MEIGFIGLGIMGKPMALNLLEYGYKVKVYDINEQACELLEKRGAIKASSPKIAAKESDVVITMLPSSKIVETVLFGNKGVCEEVDDSAIVIDMSSVSPDESVNWAYRFNELGVNFIDAPVSGGELRAIDGSMSIMVGCNEKIYNKVLPILKCMGNKITLVGENGSGSATKLANQIIVNVTIAAISEAIMFASKHDVNLEKMYEAIRDGYAGSNVLDDKMPAIMDRRFNPGGRVDINHKDLTNVLKSGREVNVPMQLTSNVLEMFQSLISNGKKVEDHSSLIKYYENLANYKIPKRKDDNE